ncbi:hypothetical protein YC2023_106050 [Brassica napus]
MYMSYSEDISSLETFQKWNLSAVLFSANPSYAKTKHLPLDYHYVRERVALSALEVKHIPNHQQITKSLPYEALSSLSGKLGVDLSGLSRSAATPNMPITTASSQPKPT